MKIDNCKKTSFKANILHKDGTKKIMISNIDKYWNLLKNDAPDGFGKSYAMELMENKPFDAKTFYNKVLKKFKEDTKDFNFTLTAKKIKKLLYVVELNTNAGKTYKVAEPRNHPLWLSASDLFQPNSLLTKAQSLLDYNEKGSSMEKAFNDLWYSKVVEERQKTLSK